MLRTSPGEGNASLQVKSSDLPVSDSIGDGQANREHDREEAASLLAAFVDDDRDTSQLKGNGPSSSKCLNSGNASMPVAGHTTTEPHTVTAHSLHQTAWLKPSSQDADLDGLYALRQAAVLKTMRQTRSRLGDRSLAALSDKSVATAFDQCSFAEPLSPLRERDLLALSELFQRDDIAAIEADINQRLLSLLPEPYWEDSAFDFLTEFL